MKNSLETRLGFFVALAVLAFAIILERVGSLEMFERGKQVNALFANIQDLKVGDRVKMAGVEVGRVQGIELTNNRVWVKMKLRPVAEVKTDSTATIKFTGLMGQNFVSIDFGTPRGEPLREDQYINTAEQADLSAMMQKIDKVAEGVENVTRSFTGFKIDTLVGPLRDFVTANKDPLTATISNMQAISFDLSSQISQGKGTLGKLVKDEALYYSALSTVSNLQDTATEIKATVADARKIVDQVNSGQGTVGKLLKEDTLYRETTESMTNLKEILQKVNQGQGTVGKLVNDQEFYKNAKLTLQKLDTTTESLEDQGPLSVLGLAVGTLF
ncbi:MAG TPA: MlaD family protein [Candidatus Paceibacterota bacterium]|nr:MlaD family protein [Verrucomicrobiota bacterium]HSA10877.1 MlaD family protein [Candidatus Paceibacterota bacterium]